MTDTLLAPDSIAFEDRRHDVVGVSPHPDDWLQHYNEMAYRLLRGDTLTRKVVSDAADAVSLLMSWDSVDIDRVGVVGHSYGGNTVLFHSAVDDRVRFAVASGAACSFRTKIAERTPVEMSQLLPGFVERQARTEPRRPGPHLCSARENRRLTPNRHRRWRSGGHRVGSGDQHRAITGVGTTRTARTPNHSSLAQRVGFGRHKSVLEM